MWVFEIASNYEILHPRTSSQVTLWEAPKTTVIVRTIRVRHHSDKTGLIRNALAEMLSLSTSEISEISMYCISIISCHIISYIHHVSSCHVLKFEDDFSHDFMTLVVWDSRSAKTQRRLGETSEMLLGTT